MSGHSKSKSQMSLRGNQAQDRTLPLTIPTLFITSEDDSNTPTPLMDSDGPVNVFLQHPQLQYIRDEDANSTAPLLDSGANTPICEEPTVPLTLSTFMSSGSEKLCAGEDIVMSPMDVKDIGECPVEVQKLPNYPFVHWPWPYIRSALFFLSVSSILGCFGISFTMIIQQPSVCNPHIGWWQGKTFFAIKEDGGRPLLDVLMEPARLDYLQKELKADVLRIDSISLTDANRSPVDVDRPIHLLPTLVDRLEERNMSLVIDVHIDRQSDYLPIADKARRCEEDIVFWLRQGVHGLYLKGLESLVNHTDLWQYVAQWKAIVDGSSSVSRQQRILIVSSQFLTQYRNVQSEESTRKLVEQFDLVDHFVDLRPNPFEDLKEQLEDGLRWDNGSGMPWILWNTGDLHSARHADLLEAAIGDGCSPTAVGPLILLMSLPGSASIAYSRDISTIGNGSAWDSRSALCLSESTKTLGRMNDIRKEAVPLYTNAPPKCKKDQTLAGGNNYIYRSLSNITLLERYYPRRHRYLTVVNLQSANLTVDLSASYFGGQVLLSSSGAKLGYILLSELHLQPAEALLLLLDK